MTDHDLEHKRARTSNEAERGHSAEGRQAASTGEDDADDALTAIINSRDRNPERC